MQTVRIKFSSKDQILPFFSSPSFSSSFFTLFTFLWLAEFLRPPPCPSASSSESENSSSHAILLSWARTETHIRNHQQLNHSLTVGSHLKQKNPDGRSYWRRVCRGPPRPRLHCRGGEHPLGSPASAPLVREVTCAGFQTDAA